MSDLKYNEDYVCRSCNNTTCKHYDTNSKICIQFDIKEQIKR